MSAAFLNLAKLSKAKLYPAGRHNLREIQAELGADSHIDPARSYLNTRLAGPDRARQIKALADRYIKQAGVKILRSNAVWAVELLVSLPHNPPSIDASIFFDETLKWAESFFGVPILSAVVHRDEELPHIHVLMLPLINSKMNGSALVGSPQRLASIQRSFYETVAQHFGLTSPLSSHKSGLKIREEAAEMALQELEQNPDCLSLPNVRTSLFHLIKRSPEQLVVAMNLAMPTEKLKKPGNFVKIMTKPCKPEPVTKPIGFQRRPPSGPDANPLFV